MHARRSRVFIVVVIGFIGVATAWWAVPRAPGAYWSWRSSNPVRRGIDKAKALGCFQCHGQLGAIGLRDPGTIDGEVPPWGGGTWMMFVRDEQDIRDFILDGRLQRKKKTESSDSASSTAIRMPAYRAVVDSGDVNDLIAAYKVLAGMHLPPETSPSQQGLEIAQHWGCFSCHGPGGSGGYPNPGSFTGFIPGWYGADFADLVRDRDEFDSWLQRGEIPRLTNHPIAPYFLKRQRIRMPEYANLTPADRDALWAYIQWLADSERD